MMSVVYTVSIVARATESGTISSHRSCRSCNSAGTASACALNFTFIYNIFTLMVQNVCVRSFTEKQIDCSESKQKKLKKWHI